MNLSPRGERAILMAIKDQQRTVFSHAEDYFKNNCMGVLERLFARDVVPRESVDLSKIRSILVIRQHDQLGDFMLATPVLRALRERFPGVRIGVLVREYFYDVARSLPWVDEVLVFYENSLRWTWKRGSLLIRRLRSGWDLTIVLNTVSHSLTSDILAHLSGAKYVLGSEEKVFPGCSRNYFYNLIASQDTRHRHQTDRNLDIVRYLGVDTTNLALEISISDTGRSDAARFLKDQGLNADAPAIGIHIGAGKPDNRWPVKRFSELAKVITSRYAVQILLFWGPYEKHLSDLFHSYGEVEPINVGHSNLKMLASYFSRCNALVCNDTGIMHLAAATGVPVAALFGAANPEEWKPVGANILPVRAESRKVEDIKVEDVLKVLDVFLGERRVQEKMIQ